MKFQYYYQIMKTTTSLLGAVTLNIKLGCQDCKLKISFGQKDFWVWMMSKAWLKNATFTLFLVLQFPDFWSERLMLVRIFRTHCSWGFFVFKYVLTFNIKNLIIKFGFINIYCNIFQCHKNIALLYWTAYLFLILEFIWKKHASY